MKQQKMKKTSSTARLGLWLALAAAVLTAPTLSIAVPAQQRAPQERVAEGTVVSKADAPIPGAIVYLKDTKSNAVKTYIADESGNFRFGELSQSTDYELWAESGGLHSRHKGISYISSKNNYHFTLKVE
jgi:hypothetical protein